MNTKNESCIFITTSSFFCRFLMAGLRKYPQILEIVHLIFICYLSFFCDSMKNNFYVDQIKSHYHSNLKSVSKRCLTLSFMNIQLHV